MNPFNISYSLCPILLNTQVNKQIDSSQESNSAGENSQVSVHSTDKEYNREFSSSYLESKVQEASNQLFDLKDPYLEIFSLESFFDDQLNNPYHLNISSLFDRFTNEENLSSYCHADQDKNTIEHTKILNNIPVSEIETVKKKTLKESIQKKKKEYGIRHLKKKINAISPMIGDFKYSRTKYSLANSKIKAHFNCDKSKTTATFNPSLASNNNFQSNMFKMVLANGLLKGDGELDDGELNSSENSYQYHKQYELKNNELIFKKKY